MTTSAVSGIVQMRKIYKVRPDGVSGSVYNRKKTDPNAVLGKVVSELNIPYDNIVMYTYTHTHTYGISQGEREASSSI